MNINLTRRPNERRVRKVFRQIVQKYGLTGPLTHIDFYKICFAEGIHVLKGRKYAYYARKMPDILGATITVKGTKLIYLRCLFQQPRVWDELTAWHELGHALLGHGGGSKLLLSSLEAYRSSASETEAELFADLCTDAFEVSAPSAIDVSTCLAA